MQRDFFYLYITSSHLWPTLGQPQVLTRPWRGGREIVVSCQNLRSEETEETTLDNNKHPPSHCHSGSDANYPLFQQQFKGLQNINYWDETGDNFMQKRESMA